jgi:beta-galactosidase
MEIGVCYFPEHWPRERWERDVAAMADAGFEYVRMGEFSWSVLEPERGTVEFEWLDEAVSLVTDHGMQAVLCTPTATPPKWLVDEHPVILQADRDGTVREFGSRRHYCFNSDTYREETERIVTRLAEHYEGIPGVAGWQTDNEFGCHRTVRCYCDDCAGAFRDWLRERYGDVETLNEAWGTTFWSQRHTSFEEVDPPGPTPAEHHPSRLLDYYRFSNDSVVEYNQFQADLLREQDPDWTVTHNFMGHFPTLDAFSVSEDLDLVSWDSYPTGFVQDRRRGEPTVDELRAGDPDQVSLNHDLYRGALDRPFWVMEQQPGDVNWPPDCPQPGPGAMRLWAHHAGAHGADAVLYFRWRRCLDGQEQYHAGLRRGDGSPDRGYRDATTAAGEFDQFGSVDHVDADVALLHDYDSLWALSEQPHAEAFDYWGLVDAFYGALRARSVQVDVVPPERSLDGYDAVAAPSLYLLPDALADDLNDFVRGGGHLLLGPRTGVKDEHNKLRAAPQPGPLRDVVGATVDQRESFPASVETAVELVDDSRTLADGGDLAFDVWAEWLAPAEAEAIATYAMVGITGGQTAAVRRDDLGGSVTYCGVWPGEDFADELAASLLERADVAHSARLPDGVRAAGRDGRTWLCNFTSDRFRVDAGVDWELGDETLEEFDVAVAAEDIVHDLSVEQTD